MYINSLNGFEKKIELISMTESQMALGQYIGGDVYEFSYIKVSRVLPLCFLYKEESGKDKLKRTPFQKTDLTPSPWIPDNPNIAKYVGRWADDKGIVQVEINKDANGRFKVFHENNESWNHLYNNVSWSGVELHFQSFAYSNKKELFEHPYHKASSRMILTPVNEPERIKWSFFVDGRRYDFILHRI